MVQLVLLVTLTQALTLHARGERLRTEPVPCEGLMCGFLAAFQEDLGQISKAVEHQVTLLQLGGPGNVTTAPAALANATAPASLSDLASLTVPSALKGTPNDPQLAMMSGMLGDMYDKMKERIVKANAAEKKQEAEFKVRITEIEDKKAEAIKKAGADKVDDTYDRIEAYWKRQRNNAHKQYHNLLKISHSGMQRFHKLMGLTDDAKAGKKPDMQALKEVGIGLPTVVLAEMPSFLQWCRHAERQLAEAQVGTA